MFVFTALHSSEVWLLRSTDSIKCDWKLTVPSRFIEFSLFFDTIASNSCALDLLFTVNDSVNSDPLYFVGVVAELKLEFKFDVKGGGNGGVNRDGEVEKWFDLRLGVADEEQFVDVSESIVSFSWPIIRLWLRNGTLSLSIFELFKGSVAEEEQEVDDEENELSFAAELKFFAEYTLMSRIDELWALELFTPIDGDFWELGIDEVANGVNDMLLFSLDESLGSEV